MVYYHVKDVGTQEYVYIYISAYFVKKRERKEGRKIRQKLVKISTYGAGGNRVEERMRVA